MIPLPFTLFFWVRIYTPFLCFLFSICWRAGLVVQNSLSFCLSVKLLISPSYLNEILAGPSNLGCIVLSSLSVCPALPSWPEEFLLKDQVLSLWESPCVLIIVFPLLFLIFVGFFVFDLC